MWESILPRNSKFSKEKIVEYVVSKQNYRSGVKLVAGGDVHAVSSSRSRASTCFKGWVHSEKTSKLFYRVTADINEKGDITTFIPCVAG